MVLDYIVTSNHIHLLVFDRGGRDVIPRSIRLVAGRSGQEYNERKRRKGAFCQDRYQATAVENGRHLSQCLVYIDLNIVRAGAVRHPSQWPFGGYNEIQTPRRKCKLIVYEKLRDLLGFETYNQLRAAHRSWVDQALKDGESVREAKWSESIAAGDKEFVERTKEKLGIRVKARKVREMDGRFKLRVPVATYSAHFEAKKDDIGPENTYLWNNFLRY